MRSCNSEDPCEKDEAEVEGRQIPQARDRHRDGQNQAPESSVLLLQQGIAFELYVVKHALFWLVDAFVIMQ